MRQYLTYDTTPAYEELYLLGDNAAYFGEIKRQFHVAFSSELDSKPTKKPA
jgi:hypothetical protein